MKHRFKTQGMLQPDKLCNSPLSATGSYSHQLQVNRGALNEMYEGFVPFSVDETDGEVYCYHKNL